MLDQRQEIIRLLELLGIAHYWHVVRPLPGEMLGRVLIQNEARRLNVEVPLSAANIHDANYTDKRKIAIIRAAIEKAIR